MQDTRIVSVASGDRHCLALSAVGEVYSWGDNTRGVLGHADGSASAGPRRIETLVRVENIAAAMFKSAAVDDRGSLFTWGCAVFRDRPTGLGYELDPATKLQLTPKRVDALSEDRVVGVALGHSYTLAVTDAGAVFFFGQSWDGALGHGLSTSEALPRRIEAPAETGRRFVAVAAGWDHSLAVTGEGHVYGWGGGVANGYGHEQGSVLPQLVAALSGVRVLLVYAQDDSSCAVTEKGELYTWDEGDSKSFNLGHGVAAPQKTPKRVEELRQVVAASICDTHTLVEGEDGAVWGFGRRGALGLGEADAPPGDFVVQPTLIPNLRVRTLP